MLRVLPQHADAVALVIGRAAREHKKFELDLKDRVEVTGLSDRILFVGELPPEQLPNVMQGISLLVAMPRYEGYGMTPLEAMASGVPFVATDTGYYRAFSVQGTAGTVVGLYDVDAVAEEVQGLLTDGSRLAQMSNVAFQSVQGAHSVEREADGIRKVYEDLWAAG